MPSFLYTAKTRSGERTEGTIEAPDRRTAMRQLEARGQTPIKVTEAGAAKAKKAGPKANAKKKKVSFSLGRERRAKMKLRETLLFTGELSDLLASGMTLGTALQTLSRRKTDSAQDVIVAELRDDIVQGASLSDALKRWPETFSQLFVSMVRAGEASGTLPDVLQRLRSHYERVQEAREKVLMALLYPAIILVMGLGTLVFAMLFVVPRFTAIFAELGSTLPLPTRIMIAISDGLMNYGVFIAIGLVGGFILISRTVQTEQGKHWWHRMQLKLPIMRGIIAANAYSHFARTLGALLSNGVQVLQALSIVEHTVGNVVIADEIRAARDRVTDGSTISGPLAQSKLFPQLLTDMLAVGEQSGDMSGALKHIGKRYDDELDRNVKILTTVMEPVLIVFMAVLVGFMAISILMAVFDLTSGLNV